MSEAVSDADETGGWNILVTCREGGQRRVRRALHPWVRLRRSGFRNVFLGWVDDPEAFLSAVLERCERRPPLSRAIGKIVPVERTFEVEAERFAQQLVVEAGPLLDRLAGKSFHVRVERRGHKGVIDTHECELRLGGEIHAALTARGETPVVTFRDPDIVLAVEVVGEACGLALVTREMCRRWPFVKID